MMKSLHVICGLAPPIKNPGFAYDPCLLQRKSLAVFRQYNCEISSRLFKSGQIFYCTHCITPKRVTRFRRPSPRHCARETQLILKKSRSGGEPSAKLCPI